MELLNQSCLDHSRYPLNLVCPNVVRDNLEAYYNRLSNTKSRLFDAKNASLHIFDYYSIGQGFDRGQISNLNDLKEVVRPATIANGTDPLCRFIFLHALNSRAPLSVAHNMLTFILSYHQVFPSFLDYLFSFGKQVYAKSSTFNSLKEDSRIDSRRKSLEISQLDRSGHQFQLCYNLHSVESPKACSNDSPSWSIRQAAIYHSFDLRSGRSVWIIIKANELLKDRITKAEIAPQPRRSSAALESFSSSLATHLLVCNWSGENWRWFIEDLEDKFQRLSGDALAIPIEPFPTHQEFIDQMNMSQSESIRYLKDSRASTLVGDCSNMTTDKTTDPICIAAASTQLPRNRRLRGKFRFMWLRLKSSWAASCNELKTPDEESPVAQERVELVDRTADNMPPPPPPPSVPASGGRSSRPSERFNIENFQELQNVEEKAQEILLILRHNVKVLRGLRQFYTRMATRPEFPKELKVGSETDVVTFDCQVLSIENDQEVLQSRLETLIRRICNRKELLNGVLQARGIQADEFYAQKALVSAARMETVTLHMRQIAKKTERETVSMRVITSVTLFFLPATFLATLIGAGIYEFKDGKQELHGRALGIYFGIAVPMTLITFLAWWLIYRFAKNRDDRRGRLGNDQDNSDDV